MAANLIQVLWRTRTLSIPNQCGSATSSAPIRTIHRPCFSTRSSPLSILLNPRSPAVESTHAPSPNSNPPAPPPRATMASSAIFSAPTLLKNNARHLTPSHRSFHGLRPLMPTDTFLWASTTKKSMSKSKAAAVKPAGKMGVRAELNPQIVICLCNGLSLFLGRFVFFNFQRDNVAKQGLPKQNGVSHFEAGDVRAQEYVNLLKSNDPVGFNIVDVLAWGSIGHIVAYYVLATSSNGYDPSFFG